MNNVIQDALDDLSSFRSSTSRQGRALDALERLLADICVSGNSSAIQSFTALQDTFQANIPSRLLTWISDRSSYLDTLSQKGNVTQEQAPEVTTLSSLIVQSLSIIQGVALIHANSKQYLGRRFALEILVDLFLVARHVTQIPITTPTSNTNASASKGKTTPPASLATVVLDTLLCIMVDSPAALRAFEEANGVRAVVRILKRAGTPRETRMKCLEFLYFYLLDETSPTPYTQLPDDHEIPTVPNSPTHSSHTRSALSLSQLSDSSACSDYSTSSAGSSLSVSTAATSVSSSSSSSQTSRSSSHTPPSSTRTAPPKISSRDPPIAQTRPLHLRNKESDSSSQAVRCTVTPTPRATPRLTQQSSDSAVPQLSELKTPRRMPLRTSATSLADVDPSTPSTPVRTRGHRRAHTIDTQADAKALSPFVKSPPMSPISDTTDAMSVGTLRSSIARSVIASSPPRRQAATRTMEEKKAILGSMMGNVDTLVEGVMKAGIWGLG